MQTLKKIPGKALESETIQGSFYIGTVEQPNPGYNIMEIWKDVPGFEGKYQISNLGRVKSFKRNCKGIIKTLSITVHGYNDICLWVNNKRRHHSVHRLVLLAFIPNPENKPCANHINGIKTDNRIENLGWITYSENEKHSYRILGKQQPKKPVAQYDLNGILLNTFESALAAAKYINGSQGAISNNCNDKQKTRLLSFGKIVRKLKYLHPCKTNLFMKSISII